MATRTASGCAFALLMHSGAVHAADVPSMLHTNSGDLAPACTPAGLAAMRADLFRVVGSRARQDAWRLAQVLACATGPTAHRVIASHVRGRAMSRIEPAPDEVSTVDAASDPLRDGYLKGLAWGARVEALPDGRASLQFSTNEICWAGATLRFEGKRWLIAELNGGCD